MKMKIFNLLCKLVTDCKFWPQDISAPVSLIFRKYFIVCYQHIVLTYHEKSEFIGSRSIDEAFI